MDMISFLVSNWDRITSIGAAIGSSIGWYFQAKKTKAAEEREARASDADYYRKILDDQYKHIDRLSNRLDEMFTQHEKDIANLKAYYEKQLMEAYEEIRRLKERNEQLKMQLSNATQD